MNQDKEYGTIKLKIDEVIEKALNNDELCLSKTKIMQRAEIQRKQYNDYYNGSIQRVDLAVLTRLMHICHCESITEVIEYIPAKKSINT